MNSKKRIVKYGKISQLMLILLILLSLPLSSALAADNNEFVFAGKEPLVTKSSSFAAVEPLPLSEIHRMQSKTSLLGIREVRASGRDTIDGVRRKENDFVQLKAVVDSDADGITPEQVWLGQARSFDSCDQPTGSYWECLLRIPATGEDTKDAKMYTYSVYYFDLPQNVTPDVSGGSRKEGKIGIDNLAPSIISLSATPQRVGQGNVTISYNIKDLTCSGCGCAGLKEIVVKKNESILDTIPVTSQSCSVQGTVKLSSSRLSQGNNLITVIARDRFDQESAPALFAVFVDTTQPPLSQENVAVYDAQNNLVRFVPVGNVRVKVVVNIADPDLNPGSVVANFSRMKPGYENVPGQCFGISTGYECEWLLTANFSGDQTFMISATDNFNNAVQQTVNLNVQVDGTAPVVTSIASNRADSAGQQYIGSNTTITVNIQESGSGFSQKKVWLDLSSVGLGKKQADSCTPSWQCVFENISIPLISGQRIITVDPESSDDVGNVVTGTLILQIRADAQGPQVQQVVVQAFRNGQNVSEAATGDTLKITATVKEASPSLTAVANLSSLVEQLDGLDGSCQRLSNASDTWGCVFETPAISFSGPFQSVVKLKFTDFIGNSVEYPVPVKVLGVLNGSFNFWSSSVQCSPELVDREVAPSVNYRINCKVLFSSPNAELLSLDKAQCSGADMSFVQSDRLISLGGSDADPLKNSPILEIVLEKNEYRTSELNLECPFTIMSKVGNNLVGSPEIEKVNIKIKFFNMPLGEFSAEVDDKIDAARKKAEGLWAFIGILRKIFFYAERICKILGTYHQVVLAMQVFDKGVNTAAISAKMTPASPFWEVANDLSCISAEESKNAGGGMMQTLDKFCGFVNCRASRPDKDPTDKKKGIFGTAYEGILNWDGFGGDMINSEKKFGLTWGMPYGSYANAKDNLLVALATGCIPGIIYGLDKYRQIECGYGVCLQEAVKGDGVPISTCDSIKEYQTCKYITGEIFALIPWTAFFDYAMGLIKQALSDPLTAIGAVISMFGCRVFCDKTDSSGKAVIKWVGTGTTSNPGCSFFTWLSLFGEILADVRDIINPDQWAIKDDMCAILGESDKGKGNKKDKGGFLGIF